MGSTTVVDQLIVKLGLDPRDFTKGEKEVAAGVIRTKETVRKGANEMAQGMESAAKSVAVSGGIIGKVFSRGGLIGIAIGVSIALLKKFNDQLYEVAKDVRQLGIDSRNFNQTASGLRNMQNAAELAGGSLEDATNSAAGLTKSLFDLRFNGQISESLVMLARLGVQFQDATGKQRDFKEIALDTAEALERQQKAGTMSSGDAYYAAQAAGFSGGLANLVTQGRAATAAAFAQQEARRQVTGEDVGVNTKRVQAFQSLTQAVVSETGVPLATKEGPTMTALSQGAERGITSGSQAVAGFWGVASQAAHKAAAALDHLANSAKHLAIEGWKGKGAFTNRMYYGTALDAAADKYGIDRDVFRGIARTESNFNPAAEARRNGKVTGRGIMQLNPQYFPNAGKNPFSDIDTAAQEFSRLLSMTEGTEQQRYTAALRMYHAGEGNYKRGTHLGPENAAYPYKVLSGTSLALPTPAAQGAAVAGGGGNRTDITFESVQINTNARDGEEVANDFTGAVRRKMMAAQAEAGVQ